MDYTHATVAPSGVALAVSRVSQGMKVSLGVPKVPGDNDSRREVFMLCYEMLLRGGIQRVSAREERGGDRQGEVGWVSGG